VTLPWQARGRVQLVLDPDLVPTGSLRRLARGRLVVDVHEDYAAMLADRAWARGVAGAVGRAVVAAANRLAGRADLTVVADEHLPPAAARDRLVVRNLPDAAMLPRPAEPDPNPRALYVGDLRASRGLFAMLDAVAAAPGWALDLVGPVAPADRARLDARLAGDPDLGARVRLHGRLPPQQAWASAAGAWAGLLLLERTPAFEAAMPTKLYEYLACGLAVVTTDLPRPAGLVGAAGAGAVVTDGAAAGAVLRAWSADPARLAAHRAAARTWWAQQAGSPYDEMAARVAALVRGGARTR
jgi:glycosyltransferase involved in cell wall biosynthesis